MKVLIIYASNSGNTMLVANRITTVLAERFNVTERNVGEIEPKDLADFDVVLFGAPTWLRDTPDGPKQGMLMKQFYEFGQQLKKGKKFADKPFAVFALGRREYTYFCQAADELERLVDDIGGTLAIPSLRIDGFPQSQHKLIDGWAHDLAGNLADLEKVA